jgi:hypothetical protein
VNVILDLLTSKLGALAAWGLALSLGVYLAVAEISLHTRISDLNDAIHNPVNGYMVQVAALSRDNGTLKANQRVLEGGIDMQNAAIGRMKLESEAREAEGRALLVQLNAKSKTARSLADQVLNLLPMPGETACMAADRFILESLR